MQGIDKLIHDNKGLVYKQLNKFNLVHDPEAESIAFEALYKAICDYDSSKQTKLCTLATVYIYNALGSYVRSLKIKRQLDIVSYNGIAYSGDGEPHEFIELIPSSVDIERSYIQSEKNKRVSETFNMLYDNLTNEKHKLILAIWRDSDYTALTTDISKQVNVSQSYVSQVINNFKFSLKKKLEDVYYD